MGRTEFTDKDMRHLVAYIAVKNPLRRNRLGQKLYQQLVENADKWSWAERHSWQSWLENYKKNQSYYDRKIRSYQDRHNISRSPSPDPDLPNTPRSRNPFTVKEDARLIAFLAEIAPVKGGKPGWNGTRIYENILVADPEAYPWASTHSWQSWRERYKKRQKDFDERIDRWQSKHGINPEAQAKKVEMAYAKNNNKDAMLSPELRKKESQLNENCEPSSKPAVAKRPRPQEGEASDDTRPVKRKRVAGHTQSSSFDASAETPTPRARIMSQSLDDIAKEQDCRVEDEEVDQLFDDSSYEQGVDRPDVRSSENEGGSGGGTQELSQFDVDQEVANISDPPVESSSRVSPLPESPRPAWPPLVAPHLSPGKSTSLYPPLPTPPLRISESVDRIPGGYPESPQTRNTPQIVPEPEPMSVARSHPPTPPPTNRPSPTPIQSFSMELPEPSRLSADVEGTERENVSSPTLSRDEPHSLHGLYSQDSTILPHESSNHSTPKPSKPRFDTPVSASSCSDGPFATSPPSPRHTEVIRGLPKPRPGRSFRDNDRVRVRNVVVGGDRSNDGSRSSDTEDMEERHQGQWPPMRAKKSRAPKAQTSSQPAISASASDTLVEQRAITTDVFQHADKPPATAQWMQKHSGQAIRPLIDSVFELLHSTPPATVPSTSQNTSRHTTTQSPAVPDDDVFAIQEPVASRSKHDPYVLGTSHLPEPGTASTVSRIRPSPVPRRHMPQDRDRRRTFPAFNQHPALPDIDLVAQLRAAPSRFPAYTWTRGSSDIDTAFAIPNKRRPAPRSPSPRPLLTAPERRAARRGPSRKSVIPVIFDGGNESTVSFDQFSPSTSGLIVQAGLAAIFKQLEENHGFSAYVVRQVWRQQGMDLKATDRKLLRMRIAAESAAYSNDEESVPSDDISQKDMKQSETLVDRTPLRRRSASASASEAYDTPGEYTPPLRSRAADYLRLSAEGRLPEARQREIDLAGAISAGDSSADNTPSKPPAVPVWSKQEDAALQRGDESVALTLAQRFGEDFVRRRFLDLMRQ